MSASSISSPAQGSPAKTPRVPSCVLCQSRKVRCDRKQPCTGCVKAGVECVPSLPASIRRRRRDVDESQLAARLRRCEELLRGYDANAAANATVNADQSSHIQPVSHGRTPTTSPLGDDSQTLGHQEQISKLSNLGAEAGTMIVEHGQPRFVDNNLWASLSDEFRDLKEMLQSPPQNNDDGSSSAAGTEPSDVSTLLLGSVSPDMSLSSIHPSPVHIFRLWQTFLDNVNPLSKLLHGPTWQKRVLEASENLDTIPRSTEMVLFAIYTAAVASLSNEECENLMGDSKSTLLRQYSGATHQALIEIGFMRTSDLMVLQGFVLFLLARRQEHDAHELWILSGVAIRIAQRLGVHRDGTSLNLPPFEIEMRRRLWWQIVLLDNRNAQLSGASTSGVAIDWDTKIPSNFNDADLFPEMVQLPIEHAGQTEMTFCLVICEIAKFFKDLSAKSGNSWQGQGSAGATTWQNSSQNNWKNTNETAIPATWQQQQQQQSPNSYDDTSGRNNNAAFLKNSAGKQNFHTKKAGSSSFTDKLMGDLENHIENKFLRYCDLSIPLHQIAVSVARCMILTMKLKSRHPRQRVDKGLGMGQEEKDFLFELSLRIIEYDVQGHKSPSIKRFIWHINVYFQLETFVFMLSELNRRPVGPLSDKAWEYVEEVYRFHPELLTEESNSLYLAVGNLTLRAWRVRELEFLRQYHRSPDIPESINSLRSQRATLEPTIDSDSFHRDSQGQESVSMFESPRGPQGVIDPPAVTVTHGDMSQMIPIYDNSGLYENQVADMEAMDWDYWNQLLASENQGFVGGTNGQ